MTWKTLELEREGVILRVWLNRPEKRNAIDEKMLREVGDLFHALEVDFETRVVMLGGRGKSFCAGADREGGSTPGAVARTERERRWRGQLGRRACRAIEDCEVLTVARVQGHAIGGGCCFALSCDFRIATRDAILRVPEVALGVPLSWSATQRLIHEIGAARAREVLLMCEDIDGTRAEEWGMVHRAVEPDALDAEVSRWVERLLDMPELAVHMTKTQLRAHALRSQLADMSETDGDLIALARRSAAARKRFGAPLKGRS